MIIWLLNSSMVCVSTRNICSPGEEWRVNFVTVTSFFFSFFLSLSRLCYSLSCFTVRWRKANHRRCTSPPCQRRCASTSHCTAQRRSFPSSSQRATNWLRWTFDPGEALLGKGAEFSLNSPKNPSSRSREPVMSIDPSFVLLTFKSEALCSKGNVIAIVFCK